MTAIAVRDARARRWRYRLDFISSVVSGQLRAEFDRYVLGWLWWVLEPVSYALTFFFLVHTFFHVEGNRLWVILVSVVAWRWFARTSEAAPHLARQFSTYTRTGAVSLELLLVTFLVKETVIFFIAIGVILVPMSFIAPPLTVHLVELPLILVCEALVVYWVSAFAMFVGAYVHDFGRLFGVLISILFYFSPGLYVRGDLSALPGWAQALLALNPFWAILTSWQNVLVLHEAVDLVGLINWTVASLGLGAAAHLLLHARRRSLLRASVE